MTYSSGLGFGVWALAAAGSDYRFEGIGMTGTVVELISTACRF